MKKSDIEKVWLTDSAVWIRTCDGREASERFSEYPRLRYATEEQRNSFEVNDYGIRWETLDEDLGFDGFFTEKSSNPLYKLFMEHPELNASSVARRLGMSQSLFAQYVSGAKRPSKERMSTIFNAIREIGKELAAV